MRNGMYQTARKILIAFALLAAMTAQALGLELIPGGEAVGLEVETQGILIASVSDRCAAKLKPGDRIFAVDQIPVHTCQQLQDRIAQADGTVALSMDRNGKRLDLLAPLQPDSGLLGITVRDSLAGVGTVTYIDPSTGAFGALGHGISDPQTRCRRDGPARPNRRRAERGAGQARPTPGRCHRPDAHRRNCEKYALRRLRHTDADRRPGHAACRAPRRDRHRCR